MIKQDVLCDKCLQEGRNILTLGSFSCDYKYNFNRHLLNHNIAPKNIA